MTTKVAAVQLLYTYTTFKPPYHGAATVATIARKKAKEGKTMNPAAKKPDETTYSGRFAARLRMLREKAGLTVDEVVEAMKRADFEVTARTVYRWETEDRDPPVAALPALAAALGQKTPRTLFPEK